MRCSRYFGMLARRSPCAIGTTASSACAAGSDWPRVPASLNQGGRPYCNSFAPITALLLGGVCLGALLPAPAAADPSSDDLSKLRTEIQKEIAALKKQEAKLHQQFLDLDRKSKLLDRKSELLDEQLRTLRATGEASTGTAPAGVGAPGTPATISSAPTVSSPSPPGVEVAQAPAAAPSAPAAPGGQPSPRRRRVNLPPSKARRRRNSRPVRWWRPPRPYRPPAAS